MTVFTVTDEKLSRRGIAIQRLLKPLAKSPTGPAWERRSTRMGIILGTHDGSPSSSSFRDWRFASCIYRHTCMYFEHWKMIDSKVLDTWYLDRAYLSLYKLTHDRQEIEFICLHCDPNDKSVYKQMPHLHIKAAKEPLPHSHIALNVGFAGQVLQSIDSLHTSWESAIEMLKVEIFDRIKAVP